MIIKDTTEFKTILGYAKAIARAFSQTELTPAIVLAGAEVALNKGEVSVDPEIYGEFQRQQARELIAASGLQVRQVEPCTDEMDASEEFRTIYAMASEESISAFLRAMLPQQPITALDGEEYAQCIRYASVIAEHNQQDEITPEIFLLGAWMALKNDKFRSQLTLTTQLEQHAGAIDSLSKGIGISLPENTNLTAAKALGHSKSFLSMLNEQKNHPNPLIAILNTGLKFATEAKYLESIAYHEAGHAVVHLVLRPNVRIEKATIVPEGGAGGYVKYDETNPYFKTPTSREDFLEQLCVSLAGRIAQTIKYGELAADEGAQNDFYGATKLAWSAIAVLGLDDQFGPVMLPALQKEFGITSGWLHDEAQRRVQAVLKQQYQEAQRILNENWDKVDAIASLLMEKKTADEEEIRRILN